MRLLPYKHAGRSQKTFDANRRKVALGIGVLGSAIFIGAGFAKQVIKEIHDLKPNEFTWHPERAPKGPVSVIVSIPEQLVHVYRNGIRIAVSTCSTGKAGHETPTGVFTVLQKDKHHRSSTYNNAPMPNMNRLTWRGIALHAGKLPGYPASHGCVRLPFEFSEKLFGITHLGTPVILAGSHVDPYELIHPGMILGDYAEHEFVDVVDSLKGKKHPSDWTDGENYPVTTLIASSADKEMELVENGQVVAGGKLYIKGPRKVGEHVFVLQGHRDGHRGLAWHGISHHADPLFPLRKEEALVKRLTGDKAFINKVQNHMHPGMMMIVTDIPMHPNLRSGKDFVVMTTDKIG